MHGTLPSCVVKNVCVYYTTIELCVNSHYCLQNKAIVPPRDFRYSPVLLYA